MAVIQSGVTADLMTVGPQFKAARTENKPIDYGGRGAYSYGGFTGILPAALGANSEIFQFRWVSATNLAVIRKIRFSASVSTTMFAAGVPVQVDLVKSTAWSAPAPEARHSRLPRCYAATTPWRARCFRLVTFGSQPRLRLVPERRR